jgi:hypothetical protein
MRTHRSGMHQGGDRPNGDFRPVSVLPIQSCWRPRGTGRKRSSAYALRGSQSGRRARLRCGQDQGALVLTKRCARLRGEAGGGLDSCAAIRFERPGGAGGLGHRSEPEGRGDRLGPMDPTSIAILSAATGASIGTIAAVLVAALIGRFVWRTFRDFDQIRTDALVELRAQLLDARRRIADLEARLDSADE